MEGLNHLTQENVRMGNVNESRGYCDPTVEGINHPTQESISVETWRGRGGYRNLTVEEINHRIQENVCMEAWNAGIKGMRRNLNILPRTTYKLYYSIQTRKL